MNSDSSRLAPQPRSGASAILDAVLLCLLIVAMCSQINLGDIGRDTTAEGYVTKQLKIALPDIALFLCFGWFVLSTTVARAWRKIWWPPAPCWALIAALLLSTLHSRPLVTAVADSFSEAESFKEVLQAFLVKESKEAIAETIQFFGYFVIAPLLFVNLIHDTRGTALISRRGLALWTFFLSLLGVALLACWQLLQGSEAPRALFSSPNAYAGFMAIALPLLLARLASLKRSAPLSLGLLLAAIILVALTVTSFWATLTILVALALVALLVRAPKRGFAAITAAGVLLLLLWPRQEQLKPARVESMRLASQTEKVKKQFIEWYVATVRLSDRREASLATGAGPGNYQFNIGAYYARLPNEEKMPPDSNNLFLVQAINLGLLGLGALLWTIYRFSQFTINALRRHPDDWLAAGVLGSIAAWLLVNNFHALIVRGTGVILAFILALAIVALQRRREPASLQTEENRNHLADWMS